MTTDKEPFDGDDLVSGIYRELDAEKAPEHLNQRILRMAAQDGKQSPVRGVLFAAWMKPVAWAATIGLSLAIVLEISQTPTTTGRPSDLPAVQSAVKETPGAAAEMVLEEAVQDDARRSDRSEKSESRARLPHAARSLPTSMDEPGRSASTYAEVEITGHEEEGKVDAVAASALAPPAPDTDGKKQVSDTPTAAGPMLDTRFSLLSMDQMESDNANICDNATRQSKEAWLECIEFLRQSGDEKAADREYKAFVLRFPAESRDLEENK